VDLRTLAWVGLGSAVGGRARYAIGAWLSRGLFPTGTLAVNVLGSFLLGLLLFHGDVQPLLDPVPRATLGAGVLGGFTTMSAFAVEAVELADEGHPELAAGYVALTLVLCLVAAGLGRCTAPALTGAR
jgi:CrcB protein